MAKKRKSKSRKTTSSGAGRKARKVSTDAQAEGRARTRKQRAVKTSTQPQIDTISTLKVSYSKPYLSKTFFNENLTLYSSSIKYAYQ